MNLADLIDCLLTRIRREQYPNREREFMRDRNALLKAIARYGYECQQRAWQFEESKIFTEINQLLDTMRGKRDQIQYLPVYLEWAIDRHIRQRADELSDEAKKCGPRIWSLVKQVEEDGKRIVVKATPVETLAALYRDLGKRERRARRGAAPKILQPALF